MCFISWNCRCLICELLMLEYTGHVVGFVAFRGRASDSSCCVSYRQRVGSSPGRRSCVLEQDTLPPLLCPSDGILKPFIYCTRIGSARKRTQNTYRGRVKGVDPGVSGSQSKHSCLLVSSGSASYSD